MSNKFNPDMTIREWGDSYNSFNSYKGLLYRENFDGILKRQLKPPIEVNIDPCSLCQLNCIWCNGRNIINQKKCMMSKKHLFDLINFCSSWGVKAICFAGGGESVLHPNISEAIELIDKLKMESAIITNGIFKNEEDMQTIAKYCRWIGISVDAGTSETYHKAKKKDLFYKVLDNAKKMSNYGALELTFKFLVHPINENEIYTACKIGRDYGFNVFHTRKISNRYIEKPYKELNNKLINTQFKKCQKLSSENYKVFTIVHKQLGEGNRRINFKKCEVSPLLCMFEANGDVSVCIDRKGDKRTRLCSHANVNNVKKAWGSDKHFKLLDKIDVEKDCPKCTMTIYHELFNAYKEDKFCWRFP